MPLSARLYRLARRLLGRRAVEAASSAVSSLAVGLGLVDARREGRPLGVSATVITYNDPDWLELAVRSVADAVDEFVVVDSSDPWDETVELLNRLSREYPMRVERQYPPQGYQAARQRALSMASYRYLLVWDSDFIASPQLVRAIRGFVESADQRFYYLVYWPWVNLCGDLSHRCRAEYHAEHWMFTASSRLRYLWDGKNEYLYAPAYYRRVWLSREPMGFHLARVRRPERVAIKDLGYRVRFYELVRQRGLEAAMEALREEARRLYGTGDLREAGLRMLQELAKGRPCFDPSQLPREVLERAKEIGVPIGSCP